MIKCLMPHATAATPPMTRILCVLQPTRIHPRWERAATGRTVGQFDDGTLPVWQKVALWKSRAQYFRANPRHAGYMLALAAEVLAKLAPAAVVDLIAALPTDGHLPSPLPFPARQVVVAPGGDCVERLRSLPPHDYDAVILLYPDAIGAGWARVERQVARWGVPAVLVVNGRRRVFLWDAAARGALRWRRFLESAWLVELTLLLALPFVSTALAVWDRLAASASRRAQAR